MSPNIFRSYENWFDGSRDCFGSLADIAAALPNVGFTPESGHHRELSSCPLSANGGNFSNLLDYVIGTGKQGRRDS